MLGKQIEIAPADDRRAPEGCRASFERIKLGPPAEALSPADYAQPYRNQFHTSIRSGWNNDPNGMMFHDGKYHVHFQHNPFWWTEDFTVGSSTYHCIEGRGAGVQFIFMFPELDLIEVLTAHHKGMGSMLTTAANRILPTFMAK